MRIRQWLAIAPVVCALALFGTACGGDDGGALEQVASLGDDSGTTDETGDDNDSPDAEPLSEEERQQAHLDFAKCMREHGIDMPDPEFREDGGVVMRQGIAIGGDKGPSPEELEAAHEACEHFLAEVIDERNAVRDPEEEERIKQQALDFAKCMRERGIDMPDPQFDGGRVTQSMEAPKDQAAFEAAMEACADENGGGAFSAGPGAGTRTEATK